MSVDSAPSSANHLIRIPEVFAHLIPDLFKHLDLRLIRPLGKEYHWVELQREGARNDPAWDLFIGWSIPLPHRWPCRPRTMEGFVEKAARTLAARFSTEDLQTLLIGALDPADRYHKTLASNLRGRALQLFPRLTAANHPDHQDPLSSTLFCLVGKEGLFAGIDSPRSANGFHPGGTRFIRQNSDSTISRAGAKIVEALHHLRLYRNPPPGGSHWIELGASPGGMTSELLDRGYRVTAIDRAALSPKVGPAPALRFHRMDVGDFQPPEGFTCDAILCDLNGPPEMAIAHVVRLARFLKPGDFVIHTLKTAGVTSFSGFLSLAESVEKTASTAGLKLIARTHLTYNRQEFTLFFEKD